MNKIHPQQTQQINIELGDKEAEGIYANLAMIIHSPTEIIVDFSRIIMTPMHAKILHKALTDNIKKFEEQYGEIKMHGAPGQTSKTIGFQTATESNIGEEK